MGDSPNDFPTPEGVESNAAARQLPLGQISRSVLLQTVSATDTQTWFLELLAAECSLKSVGLAPAFYTHLVISVHLLVKQLLQQLL